MRRILYWFTTICLGLIAGSFLLSTEVNAQNACPSSEMTCSQLDYQGGCTDPCIRVITRQGTPGRPGVPAQCACQTPINAPGSVPLGGACQQNTDCAPPGRFCEGAFNASPTCRVDQILSPAPTPLCCPVGYNSTSFSCPFGTDLDTQCCKWKGFGDYDFAPKVSCENLSIVPRDICTFAKDQGACTSCVQSGGVLTAFGCIKTNAQDFVSALLKIAMSVAGGIALLMIIYGGFQIMTSSGNPERLTGGKEIITSAIAGLLLIVFSVVILKIVGVDILGIPGL